MIGVGGGSGEGGLSVAAALEMLIKGEKKRTGENQVRLRESGRLGRVIPVSEARWRSRALHSARASAAERSLWKAHSPERSERRVPKPLMQSPRVLRPS